MGIICLYICADKTLLVMCGIRFVDRGMQMGKLLLPQLLCVKGLVDIT